MSQNGSKRTLINMIVASREELVSAEKALDDSTPNNTCAAHPKLVLLQKAQASALQALLMCRQADYEDMIAQEYIDEKSLWRGAIGRDGIAVGRVIVAIVLFSFLFGAGIKSLSDLIGSRQQSHPTAPSRYEREIPDQHTPSKRVRE